MYLFNVYIYIIYHRYLYSDYFLISLLLSHRLPDCQPASPPGLVLILKLLLNILPCQLAGLAASLYTFLLYTLQYSTTVCAYLEIRDLAVACWACWACWACCRRIYTYQNFVFLFIFSNM